MTSHRHYTLALLDERRHRMVGHLRKHIACEASDDYVADVELGTFEQCFPYAKLRELFAARRQQCDDKRRRWLNEACADAVLELISVTRWQNYRKRLAALVEELQRYPAHISQFSSGSELALSRPWDRCESLWVSSVGARFSNPESAAAAAATAHEGLFKCRKCGSHQTDNYSMQTRSADEGMTVFVRCLNCGNRWRC